MKYTTIIIFYSALCIFLCRGGTTEVIQPDELLSDAINELHELSNNVLKDPNTTNLQALTKALDSAIDYLIGPEKNRTSFKGSSPNTKSLFMDALNAAQIKVTLAAKRQQYARSLIILDNVPLDAIFYAISTKLQDTDIINFLRNDYFKKDPIVVLKGMYHNFVYQWMLYEALDRKYFSRPQRIDDLIDAVHQRQQRLGIVNQDPMLAQGLQKEQDMLNTLLAIPILSPDKAERTIYLRLVRDYMLAVFIYLLRFDTVPLNEDQAQQLYKVLLTFSNRDAFEELHADNPLHKVVTQQLIQFNPDQSEALLAYITTLNTTLTSLQNSIRR